jgi:DivIVA domain-containing protein
MPLTPEDVSNKRFTAVRLREGYDMGEVDAFLDEVEAELLRLNRENNELRTKLETAQTGAAEGQAGRPVPVAAPAPADEEAPGAVAREAHVTSFEKPGVETIRVTTTAEASSAATRLLELATRSAEELLEEARGQAEGILTSARTEAERVQQEAQTRSEQLEVETSQRREQLFSGLERDRTSLADEVESLRTFEREYRAELKEYFAKQLDALEHPLAHSERFGTGTDGAAVDPAVEHRTDEHAGGPTSG